MAQIEEVKAKGLPVAFVGDVVGTGSSRKSATNSVLWFFGDDIPGVPNKRGGGICIGGKVAPIFYNTMEDSGALVFEAPVDDLNMGDVIEIRPYEGRILNESGRRLSEFELKSDVLLDEVRAGGRINLIIGRGLTTRAREALGLPATDLFRTPEQPADTGKGYTLAQKMVGQGLRHGGRAPGHLLRAADDHRRLPGHHRPHDPGRAQGPRLPGLLRGPDHAELLPHRGLPQARGHRHAAHAAGLHHDPRRRLPAPRRRHHPQLAEPHAAARYRGHRRRLAHALPHGHLLPRRLRPGGLRGGDWA
jgi:hypothetical protein